MKTPDWARSNNEAELPEYAESNLTIIRAVSWAFLLVISCSCFVVSRAGVLTPEALSLTLVATTVICLASIVAKNKQAIFVASHALVISLLVFIFGIGFLNFGVKTAPIVALPFMPALCAKLFKSRTCLIYSAIILAGLIFLLNVSPQEGTLKTPSLEEYVFAIWLSIVSLSTTFISLYLVRRNNTLSKLLKYQSEQDFLTGLPNRYKIHERLFQDIAIANKTRAYTSVMMIDVDYFKDYNDRNGHIAGDTALVNVANKLKNIAQQENGFVGRYGGEEFIFSVTHKDCTIFNEIAEKLRRAIEGMRVEASPSRSESLTITIGLATNQFCANADYETLIHQADQALYKGKSMGRNLVEEFKTEAQPHTPVISASKENSDLPSKQAARIRRNKPKITKITGEKN